MGSEGGRDRKREGFQTDGKRRPPVLHREEDPTSYPQKDSVRSHRSSLSTPANDRYPRGDTPTIPRRG